MPINLKEFFYRGRLKAVVWMVLGSLAVFSLIVIMNRYSDLPEREDAKKSASFDVKEPPKKKPKEKPKPKPKPQKSKPKPQAPVPQLSSAVSGASFGLPDFSGADIDISDDMLGDVKDVVMTDDAVDDLPKPAEIIQPEYPSKARAKGITGYVSMSILISSKGDVESVKVLEAQPEGVFEDAATSSIRSWKFEPAKYKGQPVKVWANQTIRFSLN